MANLFPFLLLKIEACWDETIGLTFLGMSEVANLCM